MGDAGGGALRRADGEGYHVAMDIASINARDIRTALDAIRAARSLEGHPLLNLRLLVARLAGEGLADNPESRAWMLCEVLHELVKGRLTALRGAREAVDRPAPELPKASGEAQALARDFQHDDIELESWSAVYHRFLCPELQTLRGRDVAAIALPSHAGRSGERFFVRRMQRALKALEGRLRLLEREATDSAPPPLPLPRTAGQELQAHRPAPRLPRSRGPIIGRAAELEALRAGLEPGCLVSLVGPAGVGKTRLALETAALLRRSGEATGAEPVFRDGLAFVELATLPSSEHLPSALIDALHEGDRSDAMGDALTPEGVIGNREILLILDNAEHLVREVAALALTLLEACPRLGLLCTSQERLRLGNETVIELGALSTTGGAADRGVRSDPDPDPTQAARLFLIRAEQARPGYQPDHEELRAIEEICRRLDGIPLAIELAAARCGLLEPREIAKRLDDRLRLLSGGDRDLPERHRSLEAALDWSFDLLDAPAQRLLRRLAVFRGSFSLPAAEEVCSGTDLRPDQILDLAHDLADRSLLLRDAGVSGGRLRLLESVRIYAYRKLNEAGEIEAQADRHLAYCLALAERAASRLRGRDQAAWQARLAADADNMRAALSYALAASEGVDKGLQMAVALRWFWIQRGAAMEGRRWLEGLIEARLNWPEAPARPGLEADAAESAGALARCLCDYPAARAHLLRSLDVIGDDQDARRASILRSLGNVAEEEGDREAAFAAYNESLSLYEALADGWGTAAVRNNLGLLHQHAGRSEAARRELESSLSSFRELGESWAVGVTLFNLANVASDAGALELAAARYRESLIIAKELDDLDGRASARLGLANIARRAGEPDEAEAHYLAAKSSLDRLGDRQRQAEWLEGASSLLEADHAATAMAFLGAAESLREAIGAPATPAEADRIAAQRRALEARLGIEASLRALLRGQREGWRLSDEERAHFEHAAKGD